MLAAFVGAALVVFTLRDVVHELFQPSGSGTLSRLVSRGLWRLFRAAAQRRPRLLPLAGPTIVASVLTVWALLLIIGWALMYWHGLPEEFRFSNALEPAERNQFLTSIYISIVTLSTLGFGEITPETTPLRIVAGVQGLVGFGFLTAGISWILSITPVLTRRRSFAHFLNLLSASGFGDHERVHAELPTPLLLLLSERLATLRVDLINTPVAYYFHQDSESDSLAKHLPALHMLAQAIEKSDRPAAMCDSGSLLHASIKSFADVLASRFIMISEGASTSEILMAYAADHRRLPMVVTPDRLRSIHRD